MSLVEHELRNTHKLPGRINSASVCSLFRRIFARILPAVENSEMPPVVPTITTGTLLFVYCDYQSIFELLWKLFCCTTSAVEFQELRMKHCTFIFIYFSR